jgi:hypothetical protein
VPCRPPPHHGCRALEDWRSVAETARAALKGRASLPLPPGVDTTSIVPILHAGCVVRETACGPGALSSSLSRVSPLSLRSSSHGCRKGVGSGRSVSTSMGVSSPKRTSVSMSSSKGRPSPTIDSSSGAGGGGGGGRGGASGGSGLKGMLSGLFGGSSKPVVSILALCPQRSLTRSVSTVLFASDVNPVCFFVGGVVRAQPAPVTRAAPTAAYAVQAKALQWMQVFLAALTEKSRIYFSK